MITVEEDKIHSNYSRIKAKVEEIDSDSIPKIIAVSKTFSPQTVVNAIDAGINVFGESYAQEAKEKFEYFNDNGIPQPEWHFIGHLQRNKVKYIAPHVDYIHSVDSIRLAGEIDKQANRFGRKIKILIQFNTSGEATKFGEDIKDCDQIIEEIIKLENVEIVGLMNITGLNSSDKEKIKEFNMLKGLLDNINRTFNLNLYELSMGMSGDFKLAIENGATMVRIGSSIFGNREYKK